MKEFKLNNSIHFFPESWEEVKYAQYVKIVAVQQDTTLAGAEKAARIVSILTQLPLATINEAGYGLVIPLMEQLKFTQTAPQVTPITHVVINNTTYHAQELSKFGELAAFDRTETVFQDAPMEKWPYILAILLRKTLKMPQNEQKQPFWKRLAGIKSAAPEPELLYETFPNDGNWQERRAQLFKNQLSAVEVISLAAFFLSKGQASQLDMPRFSPNQLRAQLVSASSENISAANTDGKLLLSIWKKILQNMGHFLLRILTKS